MYGEWDQYIKRIEARLQDGAKLDSDADKAEKALGQTVTTKHLGKRKDRPVDNAEVLREDNVPVKHENARARSLQTYKPKGMTQRGLTVKAAQSKGGGQMSNRELQMVLSRKLMARKEDEPLTLLNESYFIEGNFGFPRCRACKKQINKYALRGIVIHSFSILCTFLQCLFNFKINVVYTLRIVYLYCVLCTLYYILRSMLC